MLQFAVGFVITPSCCGGRSKPNQRHAGTKKGLQALKKAKLRKEASCKSKSQNQASSDVNTHKLKHKLRGGGGAGKQPEQKQGIKRMPKTRVHSTLCKSACQNSAYAHYARTPVLQLKQRTDYFWAHKKNMDQSH